MDASKIAVKLSCAACGSRFRLRPKAGRPLRSVVPCPRCRAPVSVRWPWQQSREADPLAEPPPTAVLLRASREPAAAVAPRPGRAEVDEARPTMVARPTRTHAASDLIEHFRQRVRQASLDPRGPAEDPHSAATVHRSQPRYAPRPVGLLRRLHGDVAEGGGTRHDAPRWCIVDDSNEFARVSSEPATGEAGGAGEGGGAGGAARAMLATEPLPAIDALAAGDARAAKQDARHGAAARARHDEVEARHESIQALVPIVIDTPSHRALDAVSTERARAALAEAPRGARELSASGLPAVRDAAPPPESEPCRDPLTPDDVSPIAPVAVEAQPAAPAAVAARVEAQPAERPQPPDPPEALAALASPALASPEPAPAPLEPRGRRKLRRGVRLFGRAEAAAVDAAPREPGPALDDEPAWADEALAPVKVAGAEGRLDLATMQRPRSRWLWAASFALVTSAGGYAGWLVNSTSAGDATRAPQAPLASETLDALDAAHAATAAAQGDAQEAAVAVEPEAAFEQGAFVAALRDARTALEAGDREAALHNLESARAMRPEQVEHYRAYVELLLSAEQFGQAREVLWEARERFPRDSELTALLDRAFDSDARFLPEVATLGASQALTEIQRLGGGSTITLKFKRGDETVAAFKPLQTRRQSNYRSEIASWRLCQLMRCSFEIPYNRPVRIAQPDFEALYDRSDSRQRAYAANFKDLEWQKIDGVNYLYGTEKAWVTHFAKFPIEYTPTWRRWLSLDQPLAALDEPLAEALRDWRDEPAAGQAYDDIMGEAGSLTTRELARQISDLMVFDYLVGNWDRFSTVREWWGVNCQFSSGRLVSIDNGAAFPSFTASRVRARFHHVERFSRGTVQALRRLDKDRTLARLFPEPTTQEIRRFEQLWRQRGRLLARIDELIEAHGEAAVLVFD